MILWKWERTRRAGSFRVGELLAGGETSSGESRAGTVGAVPAQPELEDGRVRSFRYAMGFI